MTKKMRFLSLLITVSMLLSLLTGLGGLGVSAAGVADVAAGDIVILYTNDVHSHINNGDEGMTYAAIAQMKKDLLAKTDNVLLVDAGDHIQGTAFGAIDKGMTIIDLMNQTGYDAATLGNHEFDFGMDGAMAVVDAADYPYLSCNFKDLTTDQNVLDSYKIFACGEKKVAILGITTPATLTSSAPAYFQDEDGNFIYDILGGADGAKLFAAVQTAIDAARADGADYVIALGHIGVDGSTEPWTSRNIIAATTGLDAFIDGHSHTTMEGETVPDKDGNEVLLTQTGTQLSNVGQLHITADGTITTSLLSTYAGFDPDVAEATDSWIATVEGPLGEIAAHSDFKFTINDPSGDWRIRWGNTNMGEFNADAYYYALNQADGAGCDIAFINGGGIRAEAEGDWTYLTIQTINPWSNGLCLMEITGQQILDALEWGARYTTGVPGSPDNGAFLHAAGLTYKIDTTITSTVQSDETGLWTGAPTGEYRVYDVTVYDKTTATYKPLELDGTYTVGGINYTLLDQGDGFDMFRGGTVINENVMVDIDALVAYIEAFADSNGDTVPDLTTANSPLSTWENYKMNYGVPHRR